MFLDMVEKLTGRPLSADAWVAELNEPMEKLLESERTDYEDAIKVTIGGMGRHQWWQP